jgi:hypothetical protein
MPRFRRPRSPVHLTRQVAAAALTVLALVLAMRPSPAPAASGSQESVPVVVSAREPITDVRLVGPGVTALLPAGQVAAPVRLADLAVAALVHTGDRVDVLATAADAPSAEVVADGALVVATTGTDEEAGAGLLLLAVDEETAARLAAAATTATLTVTLPRP